MSCTSFFSRSDPQQGTPTSSDVSTPHTLGVVALSASADGERVLSSSIDGQVALWHWDGARLALGASAELSTAEVDGVAYGTQAYASALHPSGDVFAAAGDGLAPALFSAAPSTFGHGVARLSIDEGDGDGFAMKLAFVRASTHQNHDGTLLALGTSSGTVLLFDVETRAQIALVCDHAQPVRALYFSGPTSTFSDHLFVGSDDRTTTVHDLQNVRATRAPSTITALQGHHGWVLDVQSSGDGRIVATCASDGLVQLWDLAASPVASVATFSQPAPVWALAWKPQAPKSAEQDAVSTQLLAPGSDFVTGGEDGTIRRYRNAGTTTGAQVEP